MSDIKKCLVDFINKNSSQLRNIDKVHFRFVEVFGTNYSDEDIRNELITSPIENIDIGDGVKLSVICMEHWREICLIRTKL